MKKRLKLRHAMAAILLAAACVAADSKYNLRVTEYRLRFENLPESFDGFRIAQLSDLHGMRFGRDNERLIAQVARQRPDIIVLTGDMAENEKELRVFEGLLGGICGIAPVYYVRGNHEYAGKVQGEAVALAEKYGVVCLVNEYVELFRQGDNIVLAGVDDPNGRADMIKPDALAEEIREKYPDDFLLWLGHRNYWVEKYPELPADLILCGHAHGGIIRLPFVGGLFSTDHGLWATYEKGLYYGERFVMAVSTGLGNSVPAPRLLNPPELVCVELKTKS